MILAGVIYLQFLFLHSFHQYEVLRDQVFFSYKGIRQWYISLMIASGNFLTLTTRLLDILLSSIPSAIESLLTHFSPMSHFCAP